MHLISNVFLLFAIVFVPLFFVLPRDGQKTLMLVASYGFATFGSIEFALLLGLSTLLNYGFSLLVAQPARPRGVLAAAVVTNVAILGVFKYFDFFSRSLADAAAWIGVAYSPAILHLIVPLGISFYTFQVISYQIDLSRGQVKRASLFDLAIFLSFWPKFVAGPIIRATWFLPQLERRRRFTWPNFYLGAEMIIYGLFLKVVLSDLLVPQIDKVYASPGVYGGADALLAAIFFTFQIYGDFAGYSLMAIGLARILGYSVLRNFNRPNLATSFSDFWQRWHISLSRWLDDYVFKSLLPKRRGEGGSWRSVRQIYETLLDRRAIEDGATFTELAGDSLAYVQTALALEDYLGNLPRNWEHRTIADLEGLRLPGRAAVPL